MITIQHFFRGKLIVDNAATGEFKIIALSRGISLEYATELFDSAYLGTYNGVELNDLDSAFIWGKHSNVYTLTKVEKSKVMERGATFPVYHTLLIEKPQLEQLSISLLELIAWFNNKSSNFQHFTATTNDLEPYEFEKDTRILSQSVVVKPQLPIQVENTILNLFIHEMPVSVIDIGLGLEYRLGLVVMIADMLPKVLRPDVTFASHVLNNRNGIVRVFLQFLLNNSSKPNPDIAKLYWKDFRLENTVQLPFNPYIRWLRSRENQNLEVANKALLAINKHIDYELTRYDLLELLGNHLLLEDNNEEASPELIYFNLLHNPLLSTPRRKELLLVLLRKSFETNNISYLDIIITQNWLERSKTDLYKFFAKQKPEQIFGLVNLWIQKATEKAQFESIAKLSIEFADVLIPLWINEDEVFHTISDLLLRNEKYSDYVYLVAKALNATQGEYATRGIEYLINTLQDEQIVTLITQIDPNQITNPQWLAIYYCKLWYAKNFLPSSQINWLAEKRINELIILPSHEYELQVLRETHPEFKAKLLTTLLDEANKNSDVTAKLNRISAILDAFHYNATVAKYAPFTNNSKDLVDSIQKTHQILHTFDYYFSDEVAISNEEFTVIKKLVLNQISKISSDVKLQLAEQCIELSEQMPRKGGGLFSRGNKSEALLPEQKPNGIREVFLWIAGCLLQDSIS